MKRFILLAAVIAATTACGAAATPSSSAPATSSAAGSTSSASTVAVAVAVGTTSLGQVLVDSSGKTLYYFTPERSGKLVCASGTCVATWPLLIVSGSPSAGSGVTGQLTVITTPDGRAEVAYNGWPLHTYAADTQAGDTKGQGIGGAWFAATPALTSAGSGAAPSAPASATPTYNPY